MSAAKSPPFSAAADLRSPIVGGHFGHGGLPVWVQGEGVAQGNANAFANGTQGLLEVLGARWRVPERRGLGVRGWGLVRAVTSYKWQVTSDEQDPGDGRLNAEG